MKNRNKEITRLGVRDSAKNYPGTHYVVYGEEGGLSHISLTKNGAEEFGIREFGYKSDGRTFDFTVEEVIS